MLCDEKQKKSYCISFVACYYAKHTCFWDTDTLLSENIESESNVVIIDSNEQNDRIIKFSEDEETLLPKELKNHINKTVEGDIIASVATVYEIDINENKEEFEIVSKKQFDFSKSNDIKEYDEYMTELKNKAKQNENLEIQNNQEKQYPYITVGLNVSSFSKSGWDVSYQLHGYWEWDGIQGIGGYRAYGDTSGFVWSAPLSADSNSYNAYANHVLTGNPISIRFKKEEDNKGVLWEQRDEGFSTGAVLSQIHYRTYQGGQPFTIQYVYTATHDGTGSNWVIDILDLVWTYLGLPNLTNETFISGKIQETY